MQAISLAVGGGVRRGRRNDNAEMMMFAWRRLLGDPYTAYHYPDPPDQAAFGPSHGCGPGAAATRWSGSTQSILNSL